MPVRLRTLWRVPAYFLAAGFISFYLTLTLGRYIYVTVALGPNGVMQGAADPLRSALFQGALVLIAFAAGGLLVCRSMTRREVAASAGMLCAAFLILTLAQLAWPGFPLSVSVAVAPFQNLTAILASLLTKLTGSLELSACLACFAPLLFIPFGKKA